MKNENVNNKLVLVLDHDGIFHANELLENYIKRIDYRGSAEYRDYLFQLMEERELTKEKFDLLIMDHYMIKDQILEEVFSQYKGRIPYNEIYTIENAFDDVVNTVKLINNCNVYDEIILNSHVNSPFEILYKRRFHQEYLPFMKTYFPQFHMDPYNYDTPHLWVNNDRIRTNKALYLMEKRGLSNLIGYYAVDDSSSICREYEHEHAKAFYKSPEESSKEVLYRALNCALTDRREMEERGIIKKKSLF